MINSGKQLSASAQGNMAVAESDGQRAQVQRFGDKGGVAQVEGHKWVFSFSFQYFLFLLFTCKFIRIWIDSFEITK